jgi:hypothetical protein
MTDAPPRILKVSYRSALGRKRVASFYCKVPRGGAAYELNEALTRLIITNQALWVRVDRAKPGEITPDIRASLERWLPAMQTTTSITGVNINV